MCISSCVLRFRGSDWGRTITSSWSARLSHPWRHLHIASVAAGWQLLHLIEASVPMRTKSLHTRVCEWGDVPQTTQALNLDCLKRNRWPLLFVVGPLVWIARIFGISKQLGVSVSFLCTQTKCCKYKANSMTGANWSPIPKYWYVQSKKTKYHINRNNMVTVESGVLEEVLR